jgi:hypothetical protein
MLGGHDLFKENNALLTGRGFLGSRETNCWTKPLRSRKNKNSV